MAKEIAKVLIYGDLHLCSKNYGAHMSYPKESLMYLKKLTGLVEKLGITHLIGCGDLSFGRFTTLEYRLQVEDELEKQYNMVKGNRWEVKGNHDKATYGLTEYEYYVQRGLLKPSEILQIGNVNINMVDYGEYDNTDVKIDESSTNLLITHGYFKFSSTQLPPYGEPLVLDYYEKWYGMDYIISGHIHNEHVLKGIMIKDNISHDVLVHYLPCLSRPAYMENMIRDIGHVDMFTILDNGETILEPVDIELLPIEESFNMAVKKSRQEHMDNIHIDVSDVVKRLSEHKQTIGNPEDIIMGKEDIDLRYRKKAIELLHEAMA